jgi:hypothetical protein
VTARVIALALLLATSPALAERRRNCDAATLEAAGNELVAAGLTAAALATYEQAARCKPGDTIHQRIVALACRLRLYQVAKRYLDKLPPWQLERVAQLCTPPCSPGQFGYRD